MRRLGWSDVWTWRQTVVIEPEDPHEYFATVMLGAHLERLRDELHDGYVDAVLDEADSATVEYVRLNILARRPAE